MRMRVGRRRSLLRERRPDAEEGDEEGGEGAEEDGLGSCGEDTDVEEGDARRGRGPEVKAISERTPRRPRPLATGWSFSRRARRRGRSSGGTRLEMLTWRPTGRKTLKASRVSVMRRMLMASTRVRGVTREETMEALVGDEEAVGGRGAAVAEEEAEHGDELKEAEDGDEGEGVRGDREWRA